MVGLIRAAHLDRGITVAAVLLCCLVLGCATARPSLTPRGFEEATSTATALAAAMEPRRVAVLVGVDAYRNPLFPDIAFAAADAHLLGDLLRSEEGGGFDKVTILSEPAVWTREAIVAALREARVGLLPDDTFVFYFSGHGTLAKGADGEGRLYLLSTDAEPGRLDETALDLDAVRAFFSELPVEQKALIVDACFNGQGKSVMDPTLVAEVEALAARVAPASLRGLSSGEAHLFASTTGRPAFEDPALGHGVYTHYLTQAMSWRLGEADLDGDGVLTAWEAHDYARHRTREHTGGVQIPEAALRVVGANDVLLAGAPDARKQRRQALLYDYGGTSSMFAARTLIVDGRTKGVFPGTHALPEGRHHVEVRGPDGKLELDGYVDLAEGERLAAAELAVRVREDRVLQAFRLGGGGGPPAWGALWGDGFVALEAFTALRVPRGKAKGLFVGGTVGAGVSPTAHDVERLVRRGRGLFWATGALGWSADRARFRVRLAWQGRLNFVPVARFPGPEHDLLPEETGWLFLSTGPALHLGVVLDRHLAFVAVATLQGTVLDPARTGTNRLQPFAQITAGWELGF